MTDALLWRHNILLHVCRVYMYILITDTYIQINAVIIGNVECNANAIHTQNYCLPFFKIYKIFFSIKLLFSFYTSLEITLLDENVKSYNCFIILIKIIIYNNH